MLRGSLGSYVHWLHTHFMGKSPVPQERADSAPSCAHSAFWESSEERRLAGGASDQLIRSILRGLTPSLANRIIKSPPILHPSSQFKRLSWPAILLVAGEIWALLWSVLGRGSLSPSACCSFLRLKKRTRKMFLSTWEWKWTNFLKRLCEDCRK